jgi:hypothetical protein
MALSFSAREFSLIHSLGCQLAVEPNFSMGTYLLSEVLAATHKPAKRSITISLG